MVKYLGFLFDVFSKDLYTILTSIEPLRILNLSISKHTISTESERNVVVELFHSAAPRSACVWNIRKGTTIKFGFFLQTLNNHFEFNVYDKVNFQLVLSTMESHKRILFRDVYPNYFIVCTIFKMLFLWTFHYGILGGSSGRSSVSVGAHCYCSQVIH